MAKPALRDVLKRRKVRGPHSESRKSERSAAYNMLWYVIQTYTGREEKLIRMIRKIVPKQLYGDCFVAYHEQLRRRQQENRIHIERIFPGYIFITSEAPDELFLYLKNVPAMSKMMSDGAFYFLPLDAEEARFLSRIMDERHIVRLSYVATDGKDHVSYVSGPLEEGLDRITRYQFRLRYALVRLALAGEEKEVRMGIILNDDVRRELSYGKVEAPVTVPEQYRVCGAGRETEAAAQYAPGEKVVVEEGAFAGMSALVYQVKKHDVRLGVHYFDRDMTVEVPIRCIRKLLI